MFPPTHVVYLKNGVELHCGFLMEGWEVKGLYKPLKIIILECLSVENRN